MNYIDIREEDILYAVCEVDDNSAGPNRCPRNTPQIVQTCLGENIENFLPELA